MIKAIIIGYLGRDAAINTTQGGASVINFTVAHTETWKDTKGEKQERTLWVDCSYWTDKTGIAPYLLKGTQVYVEGFPDVKSFEKRDGGIGVALTCRVLSVQLLGGQKKEGGVANGTQQQPAAQANHAAPPNTAAGADDDLPF